MSERTPLLSADHSTVDVQGDPSLTPSLIPSAKDDDVYDRFTVSQKRFITLVVSMAGLIGRTFDLASITSTRTVLAEHHLICVAFASGCFIPTISEIAKDLNTTGTVIKYCISFNSIFIFVTDL